MAYAQSYRVNRMPLTWASDHSRDIEEALTGTLKATMVAVTPLHVGNGQGSFFRVDHQLTVPASSLKGAIRSQFELLTYSCFPEQRHGAMHACNSDDNHYCPACQLFGGEGYMGRLFFYPSPVDANTRVEEKGVPISPHRAPTIQHGSGRRIFENRAPREGHQRWVEFLPVGVSLPLQIDFRNLTCDELGLLLITLGQDAAAPLSLKLGGVKAHGYGQIRIDGLTISLKNVNRFKSYGGDSDREMAADELQECIGRAKADHTRFYLNGYRDVIDALSRGTSEAPGLEQDEGTVEHEVSPEAEDIMRLIQKRWASQEDEDESR